MGLVDLFRPKWKHSDPAVRATAVRQLGGEDREALEIIAREDDDASVRRLALKKLSDPGLLQELARSDTDEGLRDLAAQRATSLLVSDAMADNQQAIAAVARLRDDKALISVAKGAPEAAAREAALERLADDRQLADVARGAEQVSTRRAAVARIDDVSLLRGLVLSEENKEVGLAALERLEQDSDALEAAAKKAKHKAVRKRARELVERATRKVTESISPGDELYKRQRALVSQVEGLAARLRKGEAWRPLARQLAEARRAMAELEAEGSVGFDARVAAELSAAADALEAEHAKRAQAREARVRRAEQAEGLRAQRSALLEEIAGLSGEEITAEGVAELEQRWQTLAAEGEPPSTDLQQRFERGLKRLGRKQEQQEPQQTPDRQEKQEEVADAREQLAAICDRAERLLEGAKGGKALERAWRDLEGLSKDFARVPRGSLEEQPREELDQRFAAVKQQLEQRKTEADTRRAEKAAQNEQRMVAQVAKLAELTQGDDLRAAERALKETGSLLKQPGVLPSRERERELKDQLGEARQALRDRVAELREAEDWKRWSNVKPREELCQAAEALEKEEDQKAIADALRKLQAKWKKIGPVPKEKSDELWERFKGACDKARERCADYFGKLDEERQQNLDKKTKLCEQVEALAESTEWDATAEKIKALQAEWKEIGPVSRKQSDAIWKRFRGACDVFFERRKKLHLKELQRQRKDNLAIKQALCEQVEALAESTEWRETAEKIKGLQGEWKKSGPAPRKQSDAIWKRFRGACDKFFDAREAHFEGERMAHLEAKEAVCAELEQLAATEELPEDAAPRKQLEAARAKFHDLPPGPRAKEDGVRERFRAACEALALAHPASFKGTDLDPVANQKRMELICQEVEGLLPDDGEEPEPEAEVGSVEDMASRLRSALVQNTFRDAEGSPAAEVVAKAKSLRDQLNRLGLVPAEVREGLLARFNDAYKKVMARFDSGKKKR